MNVALVSAAGRRTREPFLWLIVAQAMHSIEEYVFRLYDVLPPARWISTAISSDPALGFALGNGILVLFGLWCYVARVRTSRPSGTTWAWFWTVLEAANGLAHLAYAARAGGYFPGAATAPLLLGLALWLGMNLIRHERD